MTTRRAVHLKLPTARRGITLTEILIGIMIMGIGLVSLATLFPIGLLRIQEAQRYTRSAILSESAGADLAARGMLSKTRLLNPLVCYWYTAAYYPTYSGPYDPWIQDTPGPGFDWAGAGTPANAGAYRGLGGRGNPQIDGNGNVSYPNQVTLNGLNSIPGSGLPVAYDPLWWHMMGMVPDPSSDPNDPSAPNPTEYRFGDGTALGLTDSSGNDSANNASVWGLQRVTDFPLSAYSTNAIRSTFISPEDLLWQEADGNNYLDYKFPNSPTYPYVASPSPVVPDLTTDYLANNTTNLTVDWRYTWMFVGRQSDSSNGKVFDGDVVVFENRPFGFDAQLNQVAGERVVQAVFGYGALPTNANSLSLIPVGQMSDGTNVGVPRGSNNAILLLWSSATPDLQIKTGSWVADVTYERRQAIAQSRFQYVPFPLIDQEQPEAQRCNWYQVQRVTPAANTAGTPYAVFGWDRFAFVYTSTPLRDKTLWNMSNGTPYHVNAALVSPHVIGVVPRTIVVP